MEAMEAYDFATATQRVYAFWQNEVCDVFIEVMKPVMALDASKVRWRVSLLSRVGTVL